MLWLLLVPSGKLVILSRWSCWLLHPSRFAPKTQLTYELVGISIVIVPKPTLNLSSSTDTLLPRQGERSSFGKAVVRSLALTLTGAILCDTRGSLWSGWLLHPYRFAPKTQLIYELVGISIVIVPKPTLNSSSDTATLLPEQKARRSCGQAVVRSLTLTLTGDILCDTRDPVLKKPPD